MQHLLILFILLIGSTSGSGLQCIWTEEPLEILLDYFDEDDFGEQIDGFTDLVDVRDGSCRLRIKLDYHEALLTVSFTEDIQTSLVGVEQIRFETIFQPIDAENTAVINIFEYACDGEECEKRFLVDMVDWLLTFDPVELETQVTPWFTGDTSESGRCFGGNSNETRQCSGRQCIFDWFYKAETSEASRGCATDRGNHSVLLNITITNNLIESDAIVLFEFYCEFNGCNSEEFYDAVFDVISQWISTINPMLRILALIDETEEGDTTTTTSTRQVTFTPTTSQSQRPETTPSRSTTHSDRSTPGIITSAAIPTTRNLGITTPAPITNTPTTSQNPTTTVGNTATATSTKTAKDSSTTTNEGRRLQSFTALVQHVLMALSIRWIFPGVLHP